MTLSAGEALTEFHRQLQAMSEAKLNATLALEMGFGTKHLEVWRAQQVNLYLNNMDKGWLTDTDQAAEFQKSVSKLWQLCTGIYQVAA